MGLVSSRSCSHFFPRPQPLMYARTSAAWYTNPQTIALTDLLGLENKINPFPPGFEPGPLPWLVADAQAAEAAAVAAEGAMDGLQEVEAEMDSGERREQQPQEPMGLSDAELGGRWTEGSG